MLIDDHPVVALGVRLAFQERRRFVLAGTAQAPDTAVSLIEQIRPDAIVLDLVFCGTVAISTIAACREVVPEAAIVVFSSLPARLYEQQALEAGADAYLTKDNDLSDLVEVLEKTVSRSGAGKRNQDAAANRCSAAPYTPLLGDIHLTPREAEISRLLGRGYSVARIAGEIGVSSNTVAAHRDNIRRKFDCRDSSELIVRLARIYEVPTGE